MTGERHVGCLACRCQGAYGAAVLPASADRRRAGSRPALAVRLCPAPHIPLLAASTLRRPAKQSSLCPHSNQLPTPPWLMSAQCTNAAACNTTQASPHHHMHVVCVFTATGSAACWTQPRLHNSTTNSRRWACTYSRQCQITRSRRHVGRQCQVAGSRGHVGRLRHRTQLWHGALCCWCACAPHTSRPPDSRQDAAIWAGDGGRGYVVGAALGSACQYGDEGLHLCLLLGACLAQRGQDVWPAVEAVELRQQ